MFRSVTSYCQSDPGAGVSLCLHEATSCLSFYRSIRNSLIAQRQLAASMPSVDSALLTSLRRASNEPKSKKVAPGKAFLGVLRLSPVSGIPPVLHIHLSITEAVES